MIFTAHDNCKYLQLSVLFQKKKCDKTFRENRVIIIDFQEIIFTTALKDCKYGLNSIQLSERQNEQKHDWSMTGHEDSNTVKPIYKY